jgi:hypothetical protein
MDMGGVDTKLSYSSRIRNEGIRREVKKRSKRICFTQLP